MNLILFTPEEATRPLPRSDPRARHILEVLRRQVGDDFDAGLVDGPRGRGTLTACDRERLTIAFAWQEQPPLTRDPLTLVVGLPRPQTARKILREASALGVEAMHFFRSDKGEPDYAQSDLWLSDEWRRQLLTGAEQAFDTQLPSISWDRRLDQVIAGLPADGIHRIALDVYEATGPLGGLALDGPAGQGVVLALGPERGWSGAERDLLRANGFALAHLGQRILRTETAVVAALAVLKSRLGWWG